MTKDMLQETFEQLRAAIKLRWGALTERDLDTLDNSLDQLKGLLHARYGYTDEEAEREISLFHSSMDPEAVNPVETVRETISGSTPEEAAHVAKRVYKK
ncbi:MAG: hypothetical protein C0402_15670 [Thermodesulfovibrio sp.]|nr:hypothetical protein [Thermodesulfovibrio sp.]